MDTPLSTIPHCSPPNMKDYWPVHHYTVSEAPDLHPSLIWYSLFSSSSSSPTDKQKWWGTYCWLAPCVIECLHLFFPSVSSSSPTAFSFVALGLELSRPPCSYMGNDRLTPNWAAQEPQKTSSKPPGSWGYSEKARMRTDHEFPRRKSSNRRNLGERVCKDTALSQLLSLDPKTFRHCASLRAACALCLQCTAKSTKLEVFFSCLSCESTLNKVKRDGLPR